MHAILAAIEHHEKKLTFGIAVVALLISITFGYLTWRIDEKQTALGGRQTELTEQMALQGSSTNLMSVLDLVTRASSELGGWAYYTPNGGTKSEKYDSDKATAAFSRPKSVYDGGADPAEPYSEADKGRIERIELRQIPISSLSSITSVLNSDAAYQSLKDKDGNDVSLIPHYIAPLLYPKCQSDDPAVAASALVACSLLMPGQDERQKGDITTVFRNANFSKVRLAWPQLSLKGLDFSGAQFSYSNIKDVDLSNTTLAGASFRNASLDKVKLEVAMGSSIPSESDKLRPGIGATDNQTRQTLYQEKAECGDFSHCTFADSPIGPGGEGALEQPNFNGCMFVGATFVRSPCTKCDFEWADFTLATLVDHEFNECSLDRAEFKGANLTDADFRDGDAKGVTLGPSTILVNTTFIGTGNGAPLDLSGARIPGSNLTNCTFKNCAMGGLEVSPVGQDGRPTIQNVVFEQCMLRRSIFNCDSAGINRIEGGDLTGADFTRMQAQHFSGFNLSNGVKVDWIRIPYSPEIEQQAASRKLASLSPANVSLGVDSLIVIVEEKGSEFRYRGALSYKSGESSFSFSSDQDQGDVLVEYLLKPENDGVWDLVLGGRKALGGSKDKEKVKAFVADRWGIVFPPFTDPQPPA